MNHLKDDGGPAFPMCIPSDKFFNADGGMTLRDWFAGQLLHNDSVIAYEDPDTVAKSAYTIADAMLKERDE